MSRGSNLIVGVDEAGVGCIAGPLVCVAFGCYENVELSPGVRDSKKLNADQREGMIDELYEKAAVLVIEIASSDRINANGNIWQMWDELMRPLLAEAVSHGPREIIVDGTRIVSSTSSDRAEWSSRTRYIPKADDLFREVSAASIIAKYMQTCAMEELHDQFPMYKFLNHNGYPTTTHIRALEQHGPCPAHRTAYRPVKRVMERMGILPGQLPLPMISAARPTAEEPIVLDVTKRDLEAAQRRSTKPKNQTQGYMDIILGTTDSNQPASASPSSSSSSPTSASPIPASPIPASPSSASPSSASPIPAAHPSGTDSLQHGQSIRGRETIDSFRGEYRFLSNFYPLDEYVWLRDRDRYGDMIKMDFPSVEHAYQASKYVKYEHWVTMQAISVREAKALGRDEEVREDWEEIKFDVMLKLLRQKFSIDPLRSKLLDTGDAHLIEGNTWRDRIWGMTRGPDGEWRGQNHLGRLLMQVREELRKPTEPVLDKPKKRRRPPFKRRKRSRRGSEDPV